jgi:hypothetical protein
MFPTAFKEGQAEPSYDCIMFLTRPHISRKPVADLPLDPFEAFAARRSRTTPGNPSQNAGTRKGNLR